MRKTIIKLTISAVLLIGGLLTTGTISLIFFISSFLFTGLEVMVGAALDILKGRVFGECFLMSTASICAIILGEYAEGIGIMLFYNVGELFYTHATGRSNKTIEAMMELKAEEATVLRDNKMKTVHPSELKIDEIIAISKGMRVPVDGKLCDRSASFDTSALTGESLPKDLSSGDEVLAGYLNLSDTVYIKVTSLYENSAIARILDLIENAAEKKSHQEKFIDRFAKVYTPVVIALALLTAIIPPLLFNISWNDSIYRALAFLVISCPCALVISVPMAFYSGIGACAKNGIIIKGSNVLETLAKADKVVFDKTGTLTDNSFELTKIHSDLINPKPLLDIVVCAEGRSTHPIAVFLRDAYRKEINHDRVYNQKEFAGLGVYAEVDTKPVFVGNEKLMEQEKFEYDTKNESGRKLHVAWDGRYAGYLVISDKTRAESKALVSDLKKLGIGRIAIMSGDTEINTKKVADETGIDEYYSDLLPSEKVQKLEKMLSDKPTIYVGDGINDAPVLTRADLGIAMGGIGSDAAIEAADAVIISDSPLSVSAAIKKGRTSTVIAKQNIVLSILIKTLIVLFSTFGTANLWAAVFADVGVSLLAVLNSLRILKK